MTDREIDALVAEHVMGHPNVGRYCNLSYFSTPKWVKCDKEEVSDLVVGRGSDFYCGDMLGGKPCMHVPLYTKSVSLALECVEKLEFSNFILAKDNGWGATFWNVDANGVHGESFHAHHEVSAAMAICQAALRARKVSL